ncbi:MAG: SpoVG family protein [candidate division KSB1 bacterium]|nr:SpoVG family protein [candidate division KSB1 bacterium]
MRITEINIKLREEPKLKAFVNITFENVFSVKGLKIIQSKKGLLLCMPSRKVEDGTQRDIAHPISKEFRDQMEREILAEYYRVLQQKELEPHEDNKIEEEFAVFEE